MSAYSELLSKLRELDDAPEWIELLDNVVKEATDVGYKMSTDDCLYVGRCSKRE